MSNIIEPSGVIRKLPEGQVWAGPSRLDALLGVPKRDVLIVYLKMKADAEDWHAVADAACDLRELDAEARGVAIGKQQDSR